MQYSDHFFVSTKGDLIKRDFTVPVHLSLRRHSIKHKQVTYAPIHSHSNLGKNCAHTKYRCQLLFLLLNTLQSIVINTLHVDGGGDGRNIGRIRIMVM